MILTNTAYLFRKSYFLSRLSSPTFIGIPQAGQLLLKFIDPFTCKGRFVCPQCSNLSGQRISLHTKNLYFFVSSIDLTTRFKLNL